MQLLCRQGRRGVLRGHNRAWGWLSRWAFARQMQHSPRAEANTLALRSPQPAVPFTWVEIYPTVNGCCQGCVLLKVEPFWPWPSSLQPWCPLAGHSSKITLLAAGAGQERLEQQSPARAWKGDLLVVFLLSFPHFAYRLEKSTSGQVLLPPSTTVLHTSKSY